MSLNGTDTYLILNYNPSPVSVSTRDTSYLIPGGSTFSPASFPLTLNEIRYINNVSKAFKYGLLFFEDDIAEEMYAELHITDWRSIMRDEEIEAILADPTVDGLERILAISDQLYFERVYGVYVGMKNAGIPISAKVEGLIVARRKELARGKSTTEISVRKAQADAVTDTKIKALEDQIAQLTAMLSAQSKPAEPEATTEDAPPQPKQKPKASDAEQAPSPTPKRTRQPKTKNGD